MRGKFGLVAISFSFISTLMACNGGAGADAGTGKSAATANGTNGSNGSKGSTQGSRTPSQGTACAAGMTCLAVKYVAYIADGAPVLSEAEAKSNIEVFNQLWSPCGINFTMEKFVPVDATDSGLDTNPSNLSDMTSIRKAYEEDTTLLVVTTGEWDRSGTLGNTAANAWTSMPGEGTYGAVLEASVATYSNIIAHELGHYLNLDHVDDKANLMNPVIYTTSTTLTSSQCSTAKAAVTDYWQKMVR